MINFGKMCHDNAIECQILFMNIFAIERINQPVITFSPFFR